MSLEGSAHPGQKLVGRINAVDVLTISAYGVAVKNGFKGTEEEWLASLEANPALIQQYVNEYLEENPPEVDATLTNEGKAADAKATGVAIASAKTTTQNHVNNTSNPHKVTKTQLGLGNVNNTSDANKPVSTAQAAAIKEVKDAALPKSGGTMSGDIVMNSKKITGLGTATSDYEAANKKYVDDTFGKALPKTGGTMSGDIAMNSKKITGLGTPASDYEGANKKYVDDRFFETTATLPFSKWSVDSNGCYYQTISVSGLLTTDRVFFDVAKVTDVATQKILAEDWNPIYANASTNGSFFVRALSVPNIDVPVKFFCVRGA